MANSMSEDALFKTLLKNKPQQQPKPPVAQNVRKETPKTPAPAPVETYEKEEPVIESRSVHPVKSAETDKVVESLKDLNSSVNMMYGMMKTVIVPVLVLILIVGIAILVKR